MIIAAVMFILAIGFFLGLFDEDKESRRTGSKERENTAQDEITFDPWTDEWYGEGPWWKKW